MVAIFEPLIVYSVFLSEFTYRRQIIHLSFTIIQSNRFYFSFNPDSSSLPFLHRAARHANTGCLITENQVVLVAFFSPCRYCSRRLRQVFMAWMFSLSSSVKCREYISFLLQVYLIHYTLFYFSCLYRNPTKNSIYNYSFFPIGTNRWSAPSLSLTSPTP